MLCRDSRVRCLGHRPPLVFYVTSGDDYCWCRSRLAIETFRNESMHLRRCSPSLKGSYELHRRPWGTADPGHTCQVIMTTNSCDQESTRSSTLFVIRPPTRCDISPFSRRCPLVWHCCAWTYSCTNITSRFTRSPDERHLACVQSSSTHALPADAAPDHDFLQ
jgi:hypothetical protein